MRPSCQVNTSLREDRWFIYPERDAVTLHSLENLYALENFSE